MSTTPADEARRTQATRRGPWRFIASLLVGILVVLSALLYMTVERVVPFQRVMIANQKVIVEYQKVMIQNQEESLEHWRAKVQACELDGGEVSRNTRGDQVCDLKPYARDEGGRFDFTPDNSQDTEVDWIIR